MTQDIDYQGCQPHNEKLRDQPNKIAAFAEIILRLATFSWFEEFLPKHDKIRIYNTTKSKSRRKSCGRVHSTKSRLMYN